MNKRYLVVEVIDDGKLRNVVIDDTDSPYEAANNVRASGIPTGIFSFVEEQDNILVRVGSLTEKVRHHFLDIKSRAAHLR